LQQLAPKPSWRLKKTLARALDFRPIEDDDVKYAWVAYKKGLLAAIGPKFADPSQMNADQFKVEFEAEVVTNFHGAWTLFAESKKGYMPVGFVFGFLSHPNPAFAPFMIVGAMIWFPWATARNRIEAAVYFFNMIRHETPMVEYADEKDKKFFEMIARHGVMRRIGTSHNVYKGRSAAVFETRSV
jgi:hypothetical protein